MSEFVLLFADDFRLDEQEGEKGSDHVVKRAYCGNDIVVLDVPVGTDRELAVSHCHFGGVRHRAVLNEVEDRVVDQNLKSLSEFTFRVEATGSIGIGCIRS